MNAENEAVKSQDTAPDVKEQATTTVQEEKLIHFYFYLPPFSRAQTFGVRYIVEFMHGEWLRHLISFLCFTFVISLKL